MPNVYFSFPASLWSSELPCEEWLVQLLEVEKPCTPGRGGPVEPRTPTLVANFPPDTENHEKQYTWVLSHYIWGIFICSNWYNGLKNDKCGVPGELKLGQSKRLKVGCFDKSLYIKPYKDIKFSTYVILGFLFVWFQLKGKNKLKKNIYITYPTPP